MGYATTKINYFIYCNIYATPTSDNGKRIVSRETFFRAGGPVNRHAYMGGRAREPSCVKKIILVILRCLLYIMG